MKVFLIFMAVVVLCAMGGEPKYELLQSPDKQIETLTRSLRSDIQKSKVSVQINAAELDDGLTTEQARIVANAYLTAAASRPKKETVNALKQAMLWIKVIPEGNSEANLQVWSMLFTFCAEHQDGLLLSYPQFAKELVTQIDEWEDLVTGMQEIVKNERAADFYWQRGERLQSKDDAMRAVEYYKKLLPMPKASVFLARAHATGFGVEQQNIERALYHLANLLTGTKEFWNFNSIFKDIEPDKAQMLSGYIRGLLDTQLEYGKQALSDFISLWSTYLSQKDYWRFGRPPGLCLFITLYEELFPDERDQPPL